MALRDYLNTTGLQRLVDDLKGIISAKFGKVTVGGTTITPTSSDDSFTIQGNSPITVTANSSNQVISISAEDVAVLDSEGKVLLSELPVGTTATTVASGNHTHGNITTDGKIGTTAGYAVYTSNNGILTAGSFATSDIQASGDATVAITSVTQDSKGKITATKSNIVHKNGFSNIGVGATNIHASSHEDTFRLIAGNNITLTPDATTNSIQINSNGSNYLMHSEHTYTAVGGETTFDITTFPEMADFDPTSDVLLISVDGLTLNADLYTMSGVNVTLDTSLQQNSVITFKLLRLGVPGDLEVLITAYNNFLAYYESHPPHFDSATNRLIFPDDLYNQFRVDISASSPIYDYANKYNALLLYLQNHQPYMDGEELEIPAVDLSPYRINT